MALTVNTNVASLTAQRQLGGSQNMLATSLERLSSGLRINSAKDDAAGLAISERFTAQVRGLNQGVRNANDGISLVQTAEGALKEVTANLQRIRELAVQSANATNSDSDRLAIQDEVSQLVAEIDRVATNTKFNGTALLDGSFTSQAFQVGADAGETITITAIDSALQEDIGGSFTSSLTATATANVNDSALVAGTSFLNGISVGASSSDGVSTDGDTYSALSKANALNAISSQTGVTVTANTELTASAAVMISSTAASDTFLLNGVEVEFDATGTAATTTAASAVTAINDLTSQTGVTAAADANGILTFTAADGRNIVIANGAGTGAISAGLSGAGVGTSTGDLAYSSGSQFGVQFTATATVTTAAAVISAGDTARFGVTANVAATGSGVALSSLSVTSVANATQAITSVDNALSTINDTRATLGAYQNRFQSVVSNLQTTSENLSASRSRIVDADFAAETAQMTKAQILQQSGIAMLAQANSVPQNVLALLQ